MKKNFIQEQLRENLRYIFKKTSASMNKMHENKVVSKGYMSKYLKDENMFLSSDKIESISNYLGIQINDLINKDLSKSADPLNISNNTIPIELKKQKPEIQFIEQKNGQVTEIPLYESTVSAGIPKEIFDYPPMKIAVAPIKQGAFAVKVSGDSMIDFKIDDGDTLVVFPTTELKFNQLVVAKCGDAYTVKKLEKRDEVYLLVPGNKKYEPFVINDIQHFEIIGYVLYIMKKPYLK